MKPNEKISYQVWNNKTKEMIMCGAEQQAFNLANSIKGQVWALMDGVFVNQLYENKISTNRTFELMQPNVEPIPRISRKQKRKITKNKRGSRLDKNSN